MKCKYCFPIKGHIKFPMGIHFTKGKRQYEFKVKDGFVTHICVVVLDYPRHSLPKVEKLNEGKVKASISIPHDPYWEGIVSDIRAIEGSLCFFGVREIDINNSSTEWLPESEKEKKELHLYSFSHSKSNEPPENMPDAPVDLFVRSILAVEDIKDSEAPLNFYRRGILDIAEERFIEAIYDFYFVLETLYGNGKFKKSQVLSEFIASTELMGAVDKIEEEISPMLKTDPEKFLLLKEKYLKNTKEKILENIIEIRGFLHHHTSKMDGIWHPANQKEYEVDAEVLLTICHCVLLTKLISILFKENHLNEFHGTKVKRTEGQTIRWK
jgi:hypothetical protein